ncbi:phage tail protein [Vibrio navarrensis]
MTTTNPLQILTKQGEELLARLAAEEKELVIDKFIFADVPDRGEFPSREEAIPHDYIVHEEPIGEKGRLTENSVIYTATLASDIGPFYFNWSGLYCSEHNVLVTIHYPKRTPKTQDQPGIAGNTLVRSQVLQYTGVAEITNITVDASTWQYNSNDRLKKMDADVAQALIDQNGKDWFIGDGFQVLPKTDTSVAITPGAGYVSGNRVSLGFERIISVPAKPAYIYLDAKREGTPTGEQITTFNFVVSAEEKDDYIDTSTGKQIPHFVCKIAQVLEDGSVSDLRPEGESAGKAWVGKNADKSFDDLEELQSSDYRFEDKRVYLQGRFKPNDGGAAYYKIKRDLVANGVYIHDLGDGWFAELQTDDNSAPVVALGLNPEAEDNRIAWRALNDLNLFKTVTVPAKTFRFSQFAPDNITIKAEPGAKFEFFYTTTPVFVSFLNRSKVDIYDLWMHSTEDDLEWQRVEFADTSDVNIYRGKISGFRHNDAAPNAWGAYFKNAKRCYLHDVEFEDNTQSDIAIVDGNEDVGIYRPKHTTDNLVVNFEPNGNEANRRVEVSGFSAKKVYLLVNTRGSNPLTEIAIKNASTRELFYDGADVSFENFICGIVYGDHNQYFTGVISAVNSFGLGDNLLIDPKLVVVGSDDGNWKVQYSTITPKYRYELFKHPNYVGIRLNPNNLNGVVYLENVHPISVDSGKTYYVHVTGTAYVPDGAPHSSDYLRLYWKNDLGEVVQMDPIRPFRTTAGTTSPVRSEGVFVTAPENATSVTVFVANAFNTTTISCILTSVTFHEARMDSTQFNDVLSKYHSLSNGPRTVYKSKLTSVDYNYQLPMLLNDVISVDGSKQMFRCIDDAYYESQDHWLGKFKEI